LWAARRVVDGRGLKASVAVATDSPGRRLRPTRPDFREGGRRSGGNQGYRMRTLGPKRRDHGTSPETSRHIDSRGRAAVRRRELHIEVRSRGPTPNSSSPQTRRVGCHGKCPPRGRYCHRYPLQQIAHDRESRASRESAKGDRWSRRDYRRTRPHPNHSWRNAMATDPEGRAPPPRRRWADQGRSSIAPISTAWN